jgi:hypothetical protein
MQHLHPVLPGAQAFVGRFQGLRIRCLDVSGRRKRIERIDRPRGPQARVAAAQDQLLGLGEELDLADAAGAELQVRARRLPPLVGMEDVDLALDRMDVGDGREIQAPPPDERLQLVQELARGLQVADRRPRLDEGRPLPVSESRVASPRAQRSTKVCASVPGVSSSASGSQNIVRSRSLE